MVADIVARLQVGYFSLLLFQTIQVPYFMSIRNFFTGTAGA